MSETISIMFDENGIAKEYDDTFDITIHCESEEEQNKVLEILNRRWIPVSERLPKEYCLFCDIDGDVFYGHIYDGRWWAEGQDDRIKNVVAWMPLPEPYKMSEISTGSDKEE